MNQTQYIQSPHESDDEVDGSKSILKMFNGHKSTSPSSSNLKQANQNVRHTGSGSLGGGKFFKNSSVAGSVSGNTMNMTTTASKAGQRYGETMR